MSLLEKAYKFFNFFINFDNRGYKVDDFAKVFVMFLGFLIAGFVAAALNAPTALTAVLLIVSFINLLSCMHGAFFRANDKSSHNFKYKEYDSTDVTTNDAGYRPVNEHGTKNYDSDNKHDPSKRKKAR